MRTVRNAVPYTDPNPRNVIQFAMGWTNNPLHQLSLRDVNISDPSFKLNEFVGDSPVTDEKPVTVEQIAKAIEQKPPNTVS